MSLRLWLLPPANGAAPLWTQLDLSESAMSLLDVQARFSEVLNDDSEDLEDRLDDFRDWLKDNDISVDVPSEAPEKMRGSKQDDEFVLSSWNTERVDGRKGEDLVRLDAALWESDLQLDGSKLVLVDRLTGRETTLKRVEQVEIGGNVFDVDALIDTLQGNGPPLLLSEGLQRMKVNTPDPTPSVLWDQLAQALVVEVQPGPTNAARIYSMLHTAIYDAYAAHDEQATRVMFDPAGDNIEFREASDSSVQDAMHYAAYTVLAGLFPDHLAVLDRVMHDRLDLSPEDVDSTEAQIGRDAGADVLAPRLAEIALVATKDAAKYTPVNPDPDSVTVIDAWTPEWREGASGPRLQKFLSPEFPLIEPFALPSTSGGATDFAAIRPERPEPFFLQGFEDAQLDIAAGTVTLAQAATIGEVAHESGAIIPVTRALIGTVINPAFITQAEQLIQVSADLNPEQRVIAEFWEDGPGTSYPPGTMMTLAQFVSTRDNHDHAMDAQLFLAMGNAMLDAAIAAWDAKVVYDYARPVQVIRDLGALGLIGAPGVDDLTGEAGYVVEAFAGYDPETGASLGTRTILASNFVTYQSPQGDFSPPFAEYVSGHSTFSGAAAAVLTALTGTTELGAATVISAGGSDFDPTFPTSGMTLSWADFMTAAEEAGLSRIYGGIHFQDGNLNGLALGTEVGNLAVDLATDFASGTVAEQDQLFSDWYVA